MLAPASEIHLLLRAFCATDEATPAVVSRRRRADGGGSPSGWRSAYESPVDLSPCVTAARDTPSARASSARLL